MKWIVHDTASKADLEMAAEIAHNSLDKAREVIPKAKLEFLDKCLDYASAAMVDSNGEETIVVGTELERDWLNSSWEVIEALMPQKSTNLLIDCLSNARTSPDEEPMSVETLCPNCRARQIAPVDDESTCESCGAVVFNSCG